MPEHDVIEELLDFAEWELKWADRERIYEFVNWCLEQDEMYDPRRMAGDFLIGRLSPVSSSHGAC